MSSKFRRGLSVELGDGGSLGGYNLPLCIYNFIYAVVLFLVGVLSFVVELGTEEKVDG